MKMQMKRTKSVSIIGAGKVGTALGALIAASGLSFQGIFSKNALSARRAIRTIGKGKIFASIDALIEASQIVIIAVRDSEISTLVGKILHGKRLGKKAYAGKIFLHTSGALPSSVLKSLSRFGASVASMHPLQTIPSATIGATLLGSSYYCVEGQTKALHAARRIIQKIGGKSFSVAAKDKNAYHLASAFLSNYVVSLTDMVLDILPESHRSKNEWMKLFVPLMEGTVKSLGRKGIDDALTGPILRGDAITISKHLEVLRKTHPDLRRLHLILANRAIEIAVRRGEISEKKRKELLRLIHSADKKR